MIHNRKRLVKRKKKKTFKKTKTAKKEKKSTPYMLFIKEEREKINRENPSLKFGEIAKLMGQRWLKMSDEEKKKFFDMAGVSMPTSVQQVSNEQSNLFSRRLGNLMSPQVTQINNDRQTNNLFGQLTSVTDTNLGINKINDTNDKGFGFTQEPPSSPSLFGPQPGSNINVKVKKRKPRSIC